MDTENHKYMSKSTMNFEKKIHVFSDNTLDYMNNPLGQSARLNIGKVH